MCYSCSKFRWIMNAMPPVVTAVLAGIAAAPVILFMTGACVDLLPCVILVAVTAETLDVLYRVC